MPADNAAATDAAASARAAATLQWCRSRCSTLPRCCVFNRAGASRPLQGIAKMSDIQEDATPDMMGRDAGEVGRRLPGFAAIQGAVLGHVQHRCP